MTAARLVLSSHSQRPRPIAGRRLAELVLKQAVEMSDRLEPCFVGNFADAQVR